ncbi:unnamed protein product [Thlaspi arvense]|uniref:Glutamyl-tRNA reductase n=1 Tax=Thlaspi arvense TaxID=13288 RepID=A0AAU9SF69_THLAR|nr:unnamed protein product [Thlaspi arvense]
MAVSSAFVVTPKLETLLSRHHNPSSSPAPANLIGVPAFPTNHRKMRGYTRERSSIVVIGLSIHTAPVEMREKLAIPEAEWSQAISELCSLNHVEEAAVLSTCNRMEIYFLALSQHRGVKEVTQWMSKRSGISVSDIRQHWFLLYNKDATRHLFEVSAGLDSLVLGEGQILAQVKQAKEKVRNGFRMTIISGLFEKAISAGKRVRTDTNIASGAVSVSSAAVELALAKLLPGSSAAMLVIGAGKMGKLVIKHLVAKGCTKMVVVNRSQEKVAAIREEMPPGVEIVYKPFDEMLSCVAEANVIFTSTASETPLFLKEHVETLPPAADADARLFVDISVPRNVGSCVAELEGARVYNVDDLREVVAANKEDRARKAMEARVIITEESGKCEAWRDSLETVPTIKKLRQKMEGIRAALVGKFMSKYGNVMDKKTKEALEELTKSMLNNILHGPMKHLRCEENDSRTLRETLENMHALNRMFELELELLEERIKAKLERQ